MDRLTKRHKYNGKDYVSVDSRKYGMSCSNFCTNCGKADYDDIRKALFKLTEYKDLEEQGKLMKLPCAVGDTVYDLQNARTYRRNLTERFMEKTENQEQQRVIIARMKITVRLMMKILRIARNTRKRQQCLKIPLGI